MSYVKQAREKLTVDHDKTPETPFLIELFIELNKARIKYCVLRNYETLPYDLQGSDLDMLIDNNYLREIKIVFETTAHKHNGQVVWRERNESMILVVCLGQRSNGTVWGLKTDLFTALTWKGFDFYPGERVLRRAKNKGGVCVAHAYDAALIGLLKDIMLIGHSQKNYFIHAANAYIEAGKDMRSEISETFGKNGEKLAKILINKDESLIIKLSCNLRRALIVRQIFKYPLKIMRNTIYRWLIYSRRVVSRVGIVVVVLGPDGVGKSTLIELVSSDITRLLHTATDHRFARPGLLPSIAKLFGRSKKETDYVINPHAHPPSGTLGSIARLAYYTIDYVLGFWIAIYPKIIKAPHVIFFDRYFYDYFFDSKRFRVRLPEWVVSVFEWAVPSPDLIVMLTVQPEIAFKRKNELSVDELSLQMGKIHSLANKLNQNIKLIDTSNSLDYCRQEMLVAVIETFKKRVQD
jgi:thymidylate kinase